MEHGCGRHLGTEPESPRGFGAVDLERLAIVACDHLDHLVNVRHDGPYEPVGPRADEDAVGETPDLAVRGEAGKGPVDGAAGAVLQESEAGEGLPRGSFRMAVRTAFAVDMARSLSVQNYSDYLDIIKARYRIPGADQRSTGSPGISGRLGRRRDRHGRIRRDRRNMSSTVPRQHEGPHRSAGLGKRAVLDCISEEKIVPRPARRQDLSAAPGPFLFVPGWRSRNGSVLSRLSVELMP